MKSFVLILFSVCFSLSGYSQKWKSFIIGVKGDTLNRVDMSGKKQGPWVVHVAELRGERGYEEEGYFINDKKEGSWRRFSLEGDLTAVENYRWGGKDGKSVYLTTQGSPIREESWKAVNPDSPYDTVNVYDVNDPGKVIAKQVIKLEGYSLKHGAWKYYDMLTGRVEKTEYWYFDKPAKKTGIDDGELAPIDITNNQDDDATAKADEKKKTVPKPKEVIDFEKKKPGKKKITVRDGSTGY
jgi:antitoxin component YwqK of YwqJK toxin-antitoxin module